MTQEDLASRVRKLGGNISQTGIDKTEKRDAKRPRYSAEIAQALNVSERWLLTGQGPKHRSASIDAQLEALPPDESARLIATINDLIDAVKIRGKIGG